MNTNKSDINSQKKLFFNILIFLLISIMAIRIPLDTDFWWHIRTGQLSFSNNIVILEDLTSFSTDGVSWINHSWLAQIFYFLIYKYTGHLGLMLFVAIISIASMWFVFNRLKGNAILNGFVMILCVLTTAVVWSPRPQLFSLLLFSITTFIVYEKGINLDRSFILLVLIFLLWGNLHAGFSVGILLIILFFIGKLLDNLLSQEVSLKSEKKELFSAGLLGILSTLVVMINPNGIGVWKVQFNTISIQVLQDLIPEWASPNFHEIYQQPFLWLWILLVFFFMINRNKYSFSEIFPIIVFGTMGFLARRNYVYFAIFAIPILGKEINLFKEEVVKSKFIRGISSKYSKELNKEPKQKVSKTINLLFIAILLFIIAGKTMYLGSPIIFHHYEKQFYPVEAVSFIKENNLENERCINSYAWGGYISWYLPQMKIFIDGRTDLYGDKILEDWLIIVQAEENWEQRVDTYQINCVFLEKNYPIVKVLIDKSWNNIFESDKAILLLKPE